MKEDEIDALMQGQEDDNGCVNYEGKSCPFVFIGKPKLFDISHAL